jgi:hypothetical protein
MRKPELRLEQRLDSFRGELWEVIEKYARQLKASSSGRDLPYEICLQQTTKGSDCFCKVVHFLLENEKKNAAA